MKTKIFIAFLSLSNESGDLKKIMFEGKEYKGIIAEKESLSLKEIASIAESLGQDPFHVKLIPIMLFG